MTQLMFTSLRFFLLSAAETVLFLAVAAYSLRFLTSGAWALAGLVGGVLGGVAAGILAVEWAQTEFSNDFGVLEYLMAHPRLGDAIDWGRILGLALLAVGFVLGRRPRTADLPG